MKYSGLQNATLQNFANKGRSKNQLYVDDKEEHAESNYLANKFDEEKRNENKRDSLFQQSDDTATQMMDPFKTGETFFAIGLNKDRDSKPPEISTRKPEEKGKVKVATKKLRTKDGKKHLHREQE